MITMVTPVNNEGLYREYTLGSTQNCKERIQYMPLYGVTHPTRAYNQAIEKARHNLVVCVHQDVRFLVNFADCLEAWLSKLPKWGVCGLAGTTRQGKMEISNFAPYDNRERRITGVMTLDGLCVILDKRNPLRFDEGFTGWHFYAEDIALQANDRGLGAYVLPCRFHHLSPRSFNGLPDKGGWFQAFNRMKQKWRKYSPIYSTVGTI